MNLKYYLRGFGIGIIVTTLVMGIATAGKSKPLSDSEIIERAKALGMTEAGILLADVAEDGLQADEEAAPNGREELNQEQQSVEPIIPTAAPKATATAVPTASPTPNAAPTQVKEDTEVTEGITIQINSGDEAYAVCEKLEEAGLIDSVSDFVTYLCENGYDKRLNVGTFIIPKDAQPEEIAKILARIQ